MSMLYLVISRATSAVLRWGLSAVSARSSSVRTFHKAMLNLFFTLVFRPRGGMFRRLRKPGKFGQKIVCSPHSPVWEADNFLTKFSRSFPIRGVSSVRLLSGSGSCRKDVLLHPRAVVLESEFSIVSDLSWTRWYLDSDLSRTWSLDSPNVLVGLDRVQQYMLFSLSKQNH